MKLIQVKATEYLLSIETIFYNSDYEVDPSESN